MNRLLLSIGLLLITSPLLAQDNQRPYVEIDSIRTQVDTPFTVPLLYGGIDSLSITAYQYSLYYDAEFVVLDSISTENSVSTSSIVQVNIENPGQLHVAVAQDQPFPTSGMLMRLHFKALNRTGTLLLAFDSFMFNEGEPEAEIKDGYVDIGPMETTVQVSADSISTLSDQPFMLPIHILHSDEPIYSGLFSLQYDPALIKPLGASTEHTLLDSPSTLVDYFTPHPGLLQFVFASSSPLQSIDSPLIHLPFRSTEQSGQSPVRFVESAINEAQSVVLAIDGHVIVQNPFIWGDTSQDSSVSIIDAVLILKHLLHLSNLEDLALKAADVSGNNVITSFDAALILRYHYGAISCFPADETCSINKHAHRAEKNLNNSTSPFLWSRLTQYPALLLTDGKNSAGIYSLDVSIPLTPEIAAQPVFQPLLPSDWVFTSSLTQGQLQISMAGSTPLPPGPVLSFQDTYSVANLAINGIPMLPLKAEMSHSIHITALYPTPFGDTTHLHYTTTYPSEIEIVMFDMLGRRVQQLFKDTLLEGAHYLPIHSRLLASGTYIIRISNSDGISVETSVIKR